MKLSKNNHSVKRNELQTPDSVSTSSKESQPQSPKFEIHSVVEVSGLEPLTTCVQGRRSPI
jgi:hypothetical protein